MAGVLLSQTPAQGCFRLSRTGRDEKVGRQFLLLPLLVLPHPLLQCEDLGEKPK